MEKFLTFDEQLIIKDDEIEQLQAENAALEAEVEQWQKSVCEQGEVIEALKAELAAAQKDAGRYRWLREKVYVCPIRFVLRIADIFLLTEDGGTTQERLDAAIDKELAK